MIDGKSRWQERAVEEEDLPLGGSEIVVPRGDGKGGDKRQKQGNEAT